jgi:single-strand DNA-binding protein
MSAAAATAKSPEGSADDQPSHVNDVHLVGRLSAEPETREMPSGDLMMSFRLVVDRPPARRKVRGPMVDTLDCAVWRKDVQRSLRAAAPGDVLEVTGALRRRFWRSPGGAVSRSEVEVSALRRAPRRAGG